MHVPNGIDDGSALWRANNSAAAGRRKKICSPSPFPIRDLFPMRKTWLRLSRPAIHLTLIRHINLYVMEGRPGEHASQRNRKWGGKDGICKTVSKPDTYGLMDYTDITHIDRYTFPFLDIFFHIFWLLVYAVWRCKFRSVFFSQSADIKSWYNSVHVRRNIILTERTLYYYDCYDLGIFGKGPVIQ